ncbi:MAG: hypothetical protein PQJ50_05055 [Spirochaetales bacterium]|nr:hypothetical protein [Spirochaetales bacterium]
MKKPVLIITLLLLSVLCHGDITRLSSLGFTFPEGRMIPPPLSAYLGEEKVELTTRNRVTVLYFWSGSNPASLTDLPLLERLKGLLGDDEILIAPVNLNDSPVEAYDLAEKSGCFLPLYLYPDNTNLKPYIMKSVPAAYIINSRGELVASRKGNSPWTHPDMVRSLREVE